MQGPIVDKREFEVVRISKRTWQWFCGLAALTLLGCSSAKEEVAAGNIQAVNHMEGTAINWLSVNGYRADGGGGYSCCVVLPAKWRPGLVANIEWEVDPDRWAKLPEFTDPNYESAYAKHKKNYQFHKASVEIPEWSGTETCDLEVHFLPCNQVKVTTACWGYGSPNNPIKEPLHMKEPASCPK
ncbi:DUF3304 domain-containing protein [Pseudomonas nitroreducens]|uniref:DUF3304 domain-containing protein n=1 Tax=Pseudomonas nitroreducens TaxID=46680 RepID=UPI003F59ADC1